jgi:branched-chain amino acid transport system substrate-binding protein
MRASRLILSALAASTLLSIECIPSSAQEPIRVGVLTIRSGPATPVGDDILAGIETATKAQGRLLGRPIELIVEESQWNAQLAVTKATKLVQQNNVVAILGTSTVEALALLPVADRLNVPIITSNSGGAALTRQNCSKWVFRTNAEDLMSTEALRFLISQHPKLKSANWYTLGHDYPFSRLVAGTVKGVKELNYVGDTFAAMDTTDWSSHIARARAAGATAIMVSVTLGTPMLQFLQQASDFGLTKEAQLVAPIGLPDWLVAKLGALSTNVISAGSWAAWRYEDTEPVTKAFNEAFFKANGRVAGMQAIQSASAATMLYAAITKANSTEPDKIVGALEVTEAPTPVGPLKFQQGGRQAMVPLFLGPYEAVNPPRYGAEYAQRVEAAFPATKSLTQSAAEAGCKLK